ncbi:transposase [Burkholderia sp. PU8-34]
MSGQYSDVNHGIGRTLTDCLGGTSISASSPAPSGANRTLDSCQCAQTTDGPAAADHWDGAGIHKSRLVRSWLDVQEGRVAIAFLPPYAPELNSVEAIWGCLKKHETANRCPTHLAEVSELARRRLRSIQHRMKLIRAFWQQAEPDL